MPILSPKKMVDIFHSVLTNPATTIQGLRNTISKRQPPRLQVITPDILLAVFSGRSANHQLLSSPNLPFCIYITPAVTIQIIAQKIAIKTDCIKNRLVKNTVQGKKLP